MAETDRTIELAGAALRDDARRARRRYRRYLAGRYDRDRLFRTVTPDVVGFEVYRLGAKRSALAGDPGFTVSLIAALRRRLRYAAMAARRGTGYPLPGADTVCDTLRVAILGELAILRRQRPAGAKRAEAMSRHDTDD
jgi:hypothetical protein